MFQNSHAPDSFRWWPWNRRPPSDANRVPDEKVKLLRSIRLSHDPAQLEQIFDARQYDAGTQRPATPITARAGSRSRLARQTFVACELRVAIALAGGAVYLRTGQTAAQSQPIGSVFKAVPIDVPAMSPRPAPNVLCST